jgi:hypothetical protein
MRALTATFETRNRKLVVPIELNLCQEARTLLSIAQECRDSQNANLDGNRIWAFLVNHRAAVEACLKGLCCLSIPGQQQLGDKGLAYRDLKKMASSLGDEPWGLRVSRLFEGSPIFDDLNIAAHCNVPAMKRLRKHDPAAILGDLDFLLSHLRIMVQTFESLKELPVIVVDDDAALRKIERFQRERNVGKILQMAHFYGKPTRKYL